MIKFRLFKSIQSRSIFTSCSHYQNFDFNQLSSNLTFETNNKQANELETLSNTTQDVLEEQIKRSESLEDIKHVISSSFKRMNPEHVAQCYQSINGLVRHSGCKEQLQKDLLGSKEVSFDSTEQAKIKFFFSFQC